MELDAVMLARIQFGFTVSFHIIFPSFTIGLSAWIATLEGIWLKTGDERYHVLARFWTKIFAVSFAMGVVSGIVLSYQFGTNWSGFSEVVGNVVAPLIGYEVLTAATAYWCYRGIRNGRELSPFVATILLFMLSYSGLAISKFPFIVPPARPGGGLDLWDTAAAPESQIFMLIGVLILLPIILCYTFLSYWSFRGKVRPGEGYH